MAESNRSTATTTTTMEFSNQQPPSIEERALEEGSFVELHSLNRHEMNGLTGEVVGHDYNLGRSMVKLDHEESKTIKVKPINCKRIPLQSFGLRRAAHETANEELGEMYECLEKERSFDDTKLKQCIEQDRCCKYKLLLKYPILMYLD